ncbi:MAG: hypothetical protein HY506_00050, partial [Candidatus Yanofskybacteria bacterium]|nr:hypothetical protein [Candidatus Yanofskybacteria bacterium]
MDERYIEISSREEVELRKQLDNRTDAEAKRIKRFLAMPDLSRTVGSPIKELADRITALPEFRDFDVIQVPEIVSTVVGFDLFNFPKDHPARSRSDTYFLAPDHILRTHTTVMWYYHIGLAQVKA